MSAIELFCITELENGRKYLGLDKYGSIIIFYCNEKLPAMSYITVKGVYVDNKNTCKLFGCLNLLELSTTNLPEIVFTKDILKELKVLFNYIDKINPSYIIPILLDTHKDDIDFMYNIFKILKIDLKYILNNFKEGEIKCQ